MPIPKTKKILICEDERPFSKALTLKLSAKGYVVVAAFDGKEAIEKFDDTYDLLLLDLVLPQVDGFQVLENVRHKNQDIPIIVLSNLGQSEDIGRVKTLGATDYFIKANTGLNDLVENIETYLK